jgi:hypothetical protein
MKPPLFAVFLDVETEGAFEFIMTPPWPVVELAVRGLNGATKTIVCIEGPPPAHMNIGGGSANRYVVSLTRNTEQYFVLQNPVATSELVDLTVGGGTSKYPVSMLVPLEMALMAAKVFTETGLAAPGLPWVGSEDIQQPNPTSVTPETDS